MNNVELKSLGGKLLIGLTNCLCGFLCWWATGVNADLRTIHADIAGLRVGAATSISSSWTLPEHIKYMEDQNKRIAEIVASIAQSHLQWQIDIGDMKTMLKSIEVKLESHMERKP